MKTKIKDEKVQLRAAVALDKTIEFNKGAPLEPGDQVYIRAAIYSRVGRVVAVNADWVGLEDSCYVGTDGRFSPFVRGDVNENAEIEPIDGVSWVRCSSIIDIQYFGGTLPLKAQ
jgi:hypothetical protein